MKYNILLKLLAVLLCAASLMGIVGGAAGTLALAENNLYHKTVDQMLDEKIQSNAAAFAEQTALSYASQELGGCPADMTQHYFSSSKSDYGYVIADPEGNILASQNPELKNTGVVFTVPVAGQYMHLVSIETEAQRLARETAAKMDSISRGLEDQAGQTVPAGGIPVNQVIFTDHQGTPIYEAYGDLTTCTSTFYYTDAGNVRGSSSYGHDAQRQIGFLFYGTDGQLMYRSFLEEWDHNFTTADVCGVMFLSHESEFLYQTENPEGLGILKFENGYLCFTGYSAEPTPTETLPEETVPETTAETTPQETSATEEAQAEAAAEDADKKESKDSEKKESTDQEAKKSEDSEKKKSDDSEKKKSEDSKSAEEPTEKKDEPSSASAVPEEDSQEKQEEKQKESKKKSEDSAPAETTVPATEAPETVPEETVAAETAPQVTEPVLINGKPLETYQVNRTEYMDAVTGELTIAKYVYLPLPEMTVEVYVNRDSLSNAEIYNILRVVREYRSYLLPAIGVCLLLFVLSAVYLCNAAGRNTKTAEVRAGGLNRIPLDLYLLILLFAGGSIIAVTVMGVPLLLKSDLLLGCSAAAAAAFVCSLLVVGFLFAAVAQCRTPDGYFLKNMLCIRFVFLCMRILQRLEAWFRETCFPWLGRILKKVWAWIWKNLIRLYGGIEKLTARSGKALNRYFSLIPLTWQWVVCGMLLFGMLLIACNTYSELLTFFCLAASLGLILYGAHCFGVLLESARKMGQGDLDTHVEDKLMVGCFQDFANDLNALADVAVVAAQNQLKSERMKTELITNVSHDIKTPLTSIINYVDLLQKPHTEEEAREYMEVLDRQSQRLKKLVEDLMDMSKASTGNMTVEITQVDAVESVNQALGEFADKLERARLYPVFRHTKNQVPIMADGKLVWRVLSNLLSNAVKYGMPGTRIYLDLTHVNDKVIISLKNISREELNITAEELMERFVRGDISRNTEGSGLGLNIAKSLMELQNGSLQLLVDGDLFKVTLSFPDAR